MEATAELFLQDGFEPAPAEGAEAAEGAAADGGQAAAAEGGGGGGEGDSGRQTTHVTSSGRAVTIEEID